MRTVLLCAIIQMTYMMGYAQDATALVQKLKIKTQQVNSYEADAIMKTEVSFLKVPQTNVKVYFKKPDKLKIKNEKGISLVPKSILGESLNGLLNGNFTALSAGSEMAGGTKLTIIKLIPMDETGETVLSTLYIDETRLLIMKAKITTRDNGTYEMEMNYGKYISYALPDRVICTFNTKDYKLPKGITFDYDDGTQKESDRQTQDTKGKVEITYTSYIINKPVPDTIF
jgi:outer membrane lipoprotein-sorting protein